MRPQVVPVCDRCRRRKQKCNTELKPCRGCINAGIECVMTDPETEEVVPRTYVLQLESHVENLEKQLAAAAAAAAAEKKKQQSQPPASAFTATSIPESVSVLPGSRYLGASSGFAFVGTALRLAYKRGILLESTLGGEEDDVDVESRQQQPSKRRGLDDLDLLPTLQSPCIPERGRMMELFEIYDQAQWQYLILTDEEFGSHLDVFYDNNTNNDRMMDCDSGSDSGSGPGSGSKDCALISAVVVYMVFAIAIQHADRLDYWNAAASNVVANSYHQQALGMVGLVMRQRSIESLRAILLVLLFSINNPQKPIVWHLLGSAMRLASHLNLHGDDEVQDVSTQDISRRLFWSLYSMDRAIGNTLGRPTVLQDDFITASLPITRGIIIENVEQQRQREIAGHCFRIRQIQSQVADTLYQKLRPINSATFFTDMQTSLQDWRATIPPHAASAPHNILDWFHHSYFNVTMFLYRPSPVNPQPCTEHLNKCFEAAGEVLLLYARIHSRGGFDAAWMAAHWLFLAAITHLFCLWTDERVRQSADWSQVNDIIHSTGMVLSAMTERWRSSGRNNMPEIYRKLSSGTLAKYATIRRRPDDDKLLIREEDEEEFQQQQQQQQQQIQQQRTTQTQFSSSLDEHETAMVEEEFDMQSWLDIMQEESNNAGAGLFRMI